MKKIAESGIYFDESLFRISSSFSRLRTPKTVFALSVWNEISVEGDNSLFPDFRLNLPLQLDYHNAWVFTAPISNYVVNQSVIKVKEVHSRGNMHSILYGAGYSIDNPALTIRAISINAACDRNQHRDSKTDVMVTDLKDIKLILYADTSFQNDMVE